MIRLIVNLFRALLRAKAAEKKTVASILSGFHAVLAELEQHAEEQLDAADRSELVRLAAVEARDLAHGEADAAHAVAEKIAELVKP